jgi:signal transduction histidine kinase
VVVGFNLVAGVVGALALFFQPWLLLISVALVLVQALALWWRRTHPAFVLAVVALTGLGLWLVAPDREPSGLALAFAVYAVSVYDTGRLRLWVAAAAICIIVVAVALLVLGDFTITRNLLPVGATSLVAWVIGDYIRSRRRFFADLVARHRQEREQAAEEERLRIARELHDVVAHNVSVMAIQAGAARLSGTSSEEALQSIERGARDTLAELNKLVGVLRKDPAAPLAPQPSLAEADTLLEPARDAGLDATIKVAGDPRQLSPAVELSAYRIIQEAITNVLKHAHAGRVQVIVDYQAAALVLTITDNGNGAPATEGAGHGLIGMREWANLFGGEMSAGSSPLGGFTVRVRLPVT